MATRAAQRRDRAGARWRDESVASEVPVALHYNDQPFAVLMATPADLQDLAVGFSLTEGVVASHSELRVLDIEESIAGMAIRMAIPPARFDALSARERRLPGYGGCGLCGTASVEAVLRVPPRNDGCFTIDEAALQVAVQGLQARQPLNAATGATHAAAFADAGGRLQLVREDVGRHNALDKLVGALAASGRSAGDGFALVTSRASYEMAMKTAQAGIPLLAAISAPTTLAIALAESSGLCLVAFAREGQCTVYAHPQRLQANR